MKDYNEAAALEALLFIAGEEGLSEKELFRTLEIDEQQLEALLDVLHEKYTQSVSGIDLIYTAGSYKLVTKALYEEAVKEYVQALDSQKLSKQALEVLAIVAYRQPVTRLAIEEIRGVQSSNLIQKLQLHDLIEESGRLDLPGRPFVYSTTAYFLDYFGLESIEDLPVVKEESETEKNLFFDSFEASSHNSDLK